MGGCLTNPQSVHIVNAHIIHQPTIVHPELHNCALGTSREDQRFPYLDKLQERRACAVD